MSFDKAVEWMENSEIAAKVQNKGFLGMRRFGKYFWYIIEKRGGKTTLLSRDIICRMPYHTSLQDVTWEQCSLREWLNHDFYLSFSLKEMKQIVRSSHANLKNDLYGTPGGVNTNDSIYLLSIAEAERLLPHNLYCGKGWWLRSPGCKEDHAAIITCENGLIIDKTGFKVDMNDAICGVRPAIIIHDR